MTKKPVASERQARFQQRPHGAENRIWRCEIRLIEAPVPLLNIRMRWTWRVSSSIRALAPNAIVIKPMAAPGGRPPAEGSGEGFMP